MKKYEKPKLMALSLSSNDRLCGDCSDKGASNLLVEDKDLALEFDWLVGNGNGIAERADVSGLFGTSEACDKVMIGYCKFTAAESGDKMVAWS